MLSSINVVPTSAEHPLLTCDGLGAGKTGVGAKRGNYSRNCKIKEYSSVKPISNPTVS